MSSILEEQNRVIIALLARSVIGIEYIEKIVKSGKKKGSPEDFVRAYNALDGKMSASKLAELVGVTQPNMSHLLQVWEEKGIVYKAETSKHSPYIGLLKLPAKADRKSNSATKGKSKNKPARRRAIAQRTTPGMPAELLDDASHNQGNPNEERLDQ